ncbi:metallophosphoesterase [Hymenobacter sublimis]|uniref:Metallophosphoesterase n=1 Tax=Hymenobacter sublimis TaxID=2933777 RepID=A0ABY4JCY7_9BACT|nr:metallophosphoesterase [Hymenobacter sublimis]UPL50326.1 metallophosphoesterase [Hymenobacter sublimis]
MTIIQMKLPRRKFLQSGVVLATGLLLLDACWLERFFIEINEFKITTPSPGTPGLRVMQLSDLHLQSINYQLVRLTKIISKLKPDLLILTGDAIDKAENIPLLHNFLQLLPHDLQKVAILGNWEYWGKIDLAELASVYSRNKCQLLINQTVTYQFDNKTIAITGLDDYVGGNPDLPAALKTYTSSDYHILLNHCPEYTATLVKQLDENKKVDFILSGHTHGGQINLFGFIPFLPRGSGKYLKGWYQENTTKLYVSKGIGTSLLPIRFGARAEIALFTLAG